MNASVRKPAHRYRDPLSEVWIVCAERVGFRIERTGDAYASTDGQGAILIANDALLDADDCLAQMILHELCHALVEGEAGERRVDWGLGYKTGAHPWREHACLRLQAWLAGSVGLREFFAPTTDFRESFWASLPADPFAATPEQGGRLERSCVAARRGAWRSAQPRWAPHLARALEASASIADSVAWAQLTGTGDRASESASAGSRAALPSLWAAAGTRPPIHPAGHAPIAGCLAGQSCSDCAWSFTFRAALRCRHAPARRLPESAPACTRYEPAAELSCRTCGACCREAYDAVEISAREPVLRSHPDWVLRDGHRLKLKRSGDRCTALEGEPSQGRPFACAIYPQRPRTCRDFAQGGANCLEARRKVGLSL